MATVPSIGRAGTAQAADATSEFYERYGGQIYRYCLRELRNHEEAEDAAQTTFLNVFRALDRGVAPEFESAWVYTIAHRVCVSRRRSSFRRGRVESGRDFDNVQEIVPSPSHDTDELLGLRTALEGLPEQQRHALLLREWQGLSCKEIAAELDVTTTAVEMLLFRARRGIVEALDEQASPDARGIRSRLRAGGDLGSLLAALKALFFAGGAKVVATLATVAATSVVVAAPGARHELLRFVDLASHAKAPVVHRPVTEPAPVVRPVPQRAAVHRIERAARKPASNNLSLATNAVVTPAASNNVVLGKNAVAPSAPVAAPRAAVAPGLVTSAPPKAASAAPAATPAPVAAAAPAGPVETPGLPAAPAPTPSPEPAPAPAAAPSPASAPVAVSPPPPVAVVPPAAAPSPPPRPGAGITVAGIPLPVPDTNPVAPTPADPGTAPAPAAPPAPALPAAVPPVAPVVAAVTPPAPPVATPKVGLPTPDARA